MLTSLHEGVLLNGIPFEDVSQLAAVKHEADFCPVCPDGVCTWVVLTREWYIKRGITQAEREANLVNPRIAATNRAHRSAISRYYRNNPKPTQVFGLLTKVRKGVVAAHNTRQNWVWVTEVTKGFSKGHRRLNRKLLSQQFSPVGEQLPVQDEFEVTTPISDEGSKAVDTFVNSFMGICFPNENVKPSKPAKAQKEATPKSSKPRKANVAQVIAAILNVKATCDQDQVRTTKLFTSRFNKAQKSFNIITTNSSKEDIGFMRDGCWIGGSWDSFMGEFWVVEEA